MQNIDNDFVNYFLKTNANNMCLMVLKDHRKVLRHFKVDPVLKIDGTFDKQAECDFN